jgi:8-oxo-dGTP pyrophosphatase MutT (NUDIX family)
VVFDPDERVFLVRFTFPDKEFWATPGGGIEPGESDLAALTRELAEEVGDVDVRAAVAIWTRTHLFPFGQYDGQRETYYFVRVDGATLHPLLSEEQLRAEHVTATGWWTIGELLAASDQFAPRRLPALVADLASSGPPEKPVDDGV